MSIYNIAVAFSLYISDSTYLASDIGTSPVIMTLPLSSVVPIAQEVAKGNDSNTMASIVETDLLIVGTGPAGASLACFLASHGMLSRKESKRP